MRGACFSRATRVAPILNQAVKRGAAKPRRGDRVVARGNGAGRAGGAGRRPGRSAPLGALPIANRRLKVAEPAPAPSSLRFTKPNRSPCTKMTISYEGIMYDSSNAVRLWIILPYLSPNCDIFGTDEAVYRPTSPFLHNLSSVLYRHSGWHRKRPREGVGCPPVLARWFGWGRLLVGAQPPRTIGPKYPQ